MDKIRLPNTITEHKIHIIKKFKGRNKEIQTSMQCLWAATNTSSVVECVQEALFI